MPKKATKTSEVKPVEAEEVITPEQDIEARAAELAAKAHGSTNHFVITESTDKNARWYVLHTYSGHENRVAVNLIQRVETMGLKEKVLELLIPTQNKIQIKRGQKKSVREKIFPGYMLVKMIMADDSWLAVRTTPGVTGFVGIGSKPTALPPEEVESIKKFMEQEAPKYKAHFSVGEAVKIIEGPFADFLGTVDHIDDAKGKVHVLVSIFGRETPVELDFLQVQNI
jgi:transcription termination/antitermination protein NusG